MKTLSEHKQPPDRQTAVETIMTPAETFGLFEDILVSGSDLRVKVTGRSMFPFLRGGEVLTIRRISGTGLRIGDLILFRDTSGLPVLHRLVKKRKSSDGIYILQTKGDALFSCDEPFPESALIGRVCRIEKPTQGPKTGVINMESALQIRLNYLIALSQLTKSHGYRFRGRLSLSIRSILRKLSGSKSPGIS